MYEQEISCAISAVKAVGQYLREMHPVVIENEHAKDIKLSHDRECEKIILEKLREMNLPVLSEESGLIGKASDKFWIVDPLDGSANFAKGLFDLTCVSIALWENDRPVLGVVYRWYNDELYWGCEEKGAYLNGIRIYTSKVESVQNAIIATGFPSLRDYGEESLYEFIKQIQLFKKVRMLGTAALMCTFVAEGKIDAYCEEDIMIWDVAAASAIVSAAGGVCRLTRKEDYKCLCTCFANLLLEDDYNAKIV